MRPRWNVIAACAAMAAFPWIVAWLYAHRTSTVPPPGPESAWVSPDRESFAVESLSIDGKDWFFIFDHQDDQARSPLLGSADALASFMTGNLETPEAAKWMQRARDSTKDSQLTDAKGRIVDTATLAGALAAARTALGKDVVAPEVEVGSHLEYLFVTTGNWPEVDPSVEVRDSVRRLGLDVDDSSPWLQESAGFVSGRQPLPKGASYRDAARVFLWTYQALTDNLRYNWGDFFSVGALQRKVAKPGRKRNATH